MAELLGTQTAAGADPTAGGLASGKSLPIANRRPPGCDLPALLRRRLPEVAIWLSYGDRRIYGFAGVRRRLPPLLDQDLTTTAAAARPAPCLRRLAGGSEVQRFSRREKSATSW